MVFASPAMCKMVVRPYSDFVDRKAEGDGEAARGCGLAMHLMCFRERAVLTDGGIPRMWFAYICGAQGEASEL